MPPASDFRALLVLALGACAAPARGDGKVVLDDPLRGSTTGTRRGGSFADGGWKVTAFEDDILWHIPTVRKGAAEFSIKGLRPKECRPGMGGKNELFHMYDWKSGDADRVYAPPGGGVGGYRNNPFKHFIRKTNCLDTRPGKTDSLEMLLLIRGNVEEPDSRPLEWDPAATYRFRVEWGPDGKGNCEMKVSRDGAPVYTMRQPGEWEPEGHCVRIGASNRRAKDEEAPLDAVFSRVKVWNLGNDAAAAPTASAPAAAASPPAAPETPSASAKPSAAAGPRAGVVKVVDHSLVDDGGPFLGLGFSYFTALRRAKFDRARLHGDLAFMSKQGFNYYRMLSMVGWFEAWADLEIAPVAFTNRRGKRVEAWPDYWKQLRELIDVAYDQYGLRTQITIFADAQLMPEKADRIAHMDRILKEVVPGRHQKIILLEVANEAWQNGFEGAQGVADLREFCRYLDSRTTLPIAVTSNHDTQSIGDLYGGAGADIATWHFSRDLRTKEGGWLPVRDTWQAAATAGVPPASSNEPIGPGSSVAAENDPIKLVMAAAYAYVAKLPMYVYHTGAGVMGRGKRFEDMAAVGDYRRLPAILPGDVASWKRNDGKEPGAPFTAYAKGQANRWWTEVEGATDGCVQSIGARKGGEFVCVPIGIREGGLTLEAREALSFAAVNPLTGERVVEKSLQAGERATLPPGPGAYILTGARAGAR